MYTIHATNVNEALPLGVGLFKVANSVRRIAPRGTATLEIKHPVLTVYKNPLERVLYHPLRDANPFFHFFEALWILAGRNDVAWLAHFLPKMSEYSDDGEVFYGAYGARIRYDEIDQLADVIKLLKADPDSRRAVVGIWQPDLDSGYTGKDMPCNCTITFKLRDGALNMTVFNRSNDMVWGAYGANAVQFATLLEYMAGMLGVKPGIYYQWSDSFHVYEDEPAWQRIKHLDLTRLDPYDYPPTMYAHYFPAVTKQVLDAFEIPVRSYPLVEVPEDFDVELRHFCDRIQNIPEVDLSEAGYVNPYFDKVALPLFLALAAHRAGDRMLSMLHANDCAASDWRLAALLWMHRRWKEA